jgi:uncharacterized protein
MDRRTVEQRTILLSISGSQAYRLNTPTSDQDYKGVCVGLKKHYLGFEKFEQKDGGWSDESGEFAFLDGVKDIVIYELRKYMQLAIENNPNILELLWQDPEDYRVITPVGQKLINNRQAFLCTKAKHSFSGYAFSQLKRIEMHRKWLLNPVEKAPTPEEFGIVGIQPMSKEQMNAFLEFLYVIIQDRIAFSEIEEEFAAFLEQRVDFKGALKQYPLEPDVLGYVKKLTNSSDNFIHLLHATQNYQAAMRAYQNYQQWKANRNPMRSALEAKVGYDAKHAMHCMRLLHMGIEILKEGVVIVNREKAGDAPLLRSVRNCEYSYEQIMAMATESQAELETLYRTSALPKTVDRSAMSELCEELVELQGWNG